MRHECQGRWVWPGAAQGQVRLPGVKSEDPILQGPVSGMHWGVMSWDPCGQGLCLHLLAMANTRGGPQREGQPLGATAGGELGASTQKSTATTSSNVL